MHLKTIVLTTGFIFTSLALNMAWSAESSPSTAQQPQDVDALLKGIQDAVAEQKRPSDQTLKQIEAILEKDPNNYRAHLVLGVCYDSLGLPMQAIDQYETAMKLKPNEPQALIELIRARAKIGGRGEAKTLLRLAKERFPDNLDVIALMGQEYLKEGQITAATGAFEEVVDSKKPIYGAYAGLAEIRLGQSRFDEAYRLGAQEVAFHPDNSKGYLTEGMALYLLKKYSQAIDPLRVALGADQRNTQLAVVVARCCYWSGRYQVGFEPAVLAAALTAQIGFEDPQGMRAILIDTMRHCPKSMIRKWVTDNSPKYERTLHNAAFHALLGDALDNIGMHDLALQQFQVAVNLAPSYAFANFKLGQMLEFYKCDYAQALVHYKKAHSSNPNDAEMMDYTERLENRLAERNGDLAWRLKDMFRGVFFNYEIPQKQ